MILYSVKIRKTKVRISPRLKKTRFFTCFFCNYLQLTVLVFNLFNRRRNEIFQSKLKLVILIDLSKHLY